MIYNVNFSTGKLEAINASDKNNLPIGTVLHLNGYSNPDSVIVHNFGINEQFVSYGAKYQTVSLEDFHYGQQDALTLMWLKDKKEFTDHLITLEELKAGFNCTIVINRDRFPAITNDEAKSLLDAFLSFPEHYTNQNGEYLGGGFQYLRPVSGDPTDCGKFQVFF